MATARQRHDWQLQAVLTAHIAAILGAKNAKAQDYMPEAFLEPEDLDATKPETMSLADAIASFKHQHGPGHGAVPPQPAIDGAMKRVVRERPTETDLTWSVHGSKRQRN